MRGCRYKALSGDDIMAQRYAKFRKLGHFSEFDFTQGSWQERRPFRLPKAGPLWLLGRGLCAGRLLDRPRRAPTSQGPGARAVVSAVAQLHSSSGWA